MKLADCQEKEKGFALPIAAGVGLIMVLIAVTMVVRSNQSQISSISQRSSNKSLAAAETGVAKYLNELNQFRNVATSNSGNNSNAWNARLNLLRARQDCDFYPQVGSSIFSDTQTWVNANGSDASQGTFRLSRYVYQPANNRGVLEIEGRSSDASAGNTLLSVDIPVSVTAPPTSTANSSGNTFSNCQFPVINDDDLESVVTGALTNEITISSPIEGDFTFPRSGDANFSTYVLNGVNGDSKTIDLAEGEELLIADNQTVFLVTDKDIKVDGGVIRIGSNARLFIISSANISISQGANTTKPAIFVPTYDANQWPIQFFMTGVDSNFSALGNNNGELQISTLSGSGINSIPIAAYAPNGTVSLEATGSALYYGNVWAHRFDVLPDNTKFLNQDVLGSYAPSILGTFPPFWQESLNIPQVQTQLSPITSWKKQSISTP